MEDVTKSVERIDGWLRKREGIALYNLAKSCKGRGVIVEIGSWKGKSTILLAKGSKAGNKIKIYAIDPHTGSSEHEEINKKIWTYEEFKNNIASAKVDDIIVPIVKTSEEAAKDFNEKVEFIFIDGSHEYEFVKLDFDLWYPKVIDGGIMAFHDTFGWPGPKKVIGEHVIRSRNFKNVRFVDLTTIAEKTKKNSFRDRLKNRYVFILLNMYDFGRSLPLPRPIRKNIKNIIKSIQELRIGK